VTHSDLNVRVIWHCRFFRSCLQVCRRRYCQIDTIYQSLYSEWSLIITKPLHLSLTFTYPESLVCDLSIEIKGSFQEDLLNLQDEDVLPKDISAYVLAKLDAPSLDWMIVSYVPDNAKVRDKVGFYIFMTMNTGLLQIDALCLN
jgi:hypothetical protein